MVVSHQKLLGENHSSVLRLDISPIYRLSLGMSSAFISTSDSNYSNYT